MIIINNYIQLHILYAEKAQMLPASLKISCAMATMIVQTAKTRWNAKRCKNSIMGKNLIGMNCIIIIIIADDT